MPKKDSEQINSNAKIFGSSKGPYNQKSIKDRIEKLFQDNIGKVVTRELLVDASKDPKTGHEPENWHQRLSELRTDDGYTILSNRDRDYLSPGEYVMESTKKRSTAGKRIMPDKQTWKKVLSNANDSCQWSEDGTNCNLKNGDIDSIGGGTVNLTADHLNPLIIESYNNYKLTNGLRVLCYLFNTNSYRRLVTPQ